MGNLKNWKLFLESLDNSDDIEEMKAKLMEAFAPLFIAEVLMRPISSKEELEDVVNTILMSFLTGFGKALEDKNELPNEYKLKMATEFSKFAQEGKKIMIDTSFKDGMIYIFENFINYAKELRDSLDNEGDEWKKLASKEETEDEFEKLSKSEIQKLIDNALDRGDLKEVEKLSKYLESSQYVNDSELTEMINKAVDILLSIVDSIYA
jgi:hypothetical protein